MVPLAKFDISLKNTPPVWRHLVQKVARGFLRSFLNFTCAHKHSRQRSYKKLRKTKGIYGKTRKPLRRKERRDMHNQRYISQRG